MVCVTDLPNNIIEAIIVAALEDPWISSSGEDERYERWELDTYLLAICHSWRAVGVPLFYQNAFIEISIDKDSKADHLCSDTCIDLIRQNGYEHLVTHLKVSSSSISSLGPCLKHVLKAISHRSDKNADVSALRAELKSASQSKKLSPKRKAELHATVEKLVLYLKRVLPNVQHLTLVTSVIHNAFFPFFTCLASCYIDQLTGLYLDMSPCFPDALHPAKPLDLTIRMEDETFGDGRRRKSIPSSKLMLDSRLIRSIKLFTDDIDFDWRFFQLGKSSKVVVFESLESVNANCDAYERPRQALYDGQHVKLKFPALRSLDISEFIIEPPLVKCLQASPLESLSYTHGCAYSIKNLIPLIAKLKRLKLSLEFNVGSSSGDDYIRTLNDVFQQTQDLEIVVCTVWDDSKLVNFRIVDWPFLTHLWIQAVFEFDDFLVALPKMTSLVNLSILIAGFNEGYSARAVAALKKHKRGYPDRFASKVEKLRLEHEIELSGFEMDELPLRPFYKKNLKLIKWYMPNVKWVAIVPM